MHAIKMDDDDKSSILLKRCIGCGNCIVTCPADAIKLVPKTEQRTPPVDGVELYEKIGKMKEKLKTRELKRQQRLAKRAQN